MTKTTQKRPQPKPLPNQEPPKPEEKPHFLLVPLSAVRLLLTDSMPLHHFLYAGFYTSAKKMKTDEDTCLNMSFNYGMSIGDCSPDFIRDVAQKVEEKIRYLSEIAYWSKQILSDDPELKDLYMTFGKLADLLSELKLDDSLASDIITYARDNHFYNRFEKDPYIAISITMAKNLLNTRNELTLDDYATLAMHMGICSKLGNKAFVATTRVEICSRMFGCKSASELENALQDPVLEALYKKFTTRRVFERLFAQVTERFHLREIGMKRHTYVSYRFPDDQSFVKAIAGSDRTLQKKKRSAELKSLIAKEFSLDIPDAV